MSGKKPILYLRIYLGLLWAVCLYRAVTQSIVHDEALTWQIYVSGPVDALFHVFDANHHFLNSLLMRVSVGLFGVSEWAVRLPALGGAALYFAAVYRIATRFFRTAAGALLATALLTLNPFVLDFMVAARGYGMALGMFTFALTILIEHARQGVKPKEIVLAGALFGLSIAANLVFAVPVFCASAMAVALLRSKPLPAPKKKKKGRERKPLNPILVFFLPALAVVCDLLFMTMPLEHAQASQFYVGTGSALECLRSLSSASFQHATFLRGAAWIADAGYLLAIPILLAALALGIRRRDPLLVAAGGVACGSALILVVAHLALGMLFPVPRTGIYFMMLAALALAALAQEAPRALAPVGAALVLIFLVQFDTRFFLTWDYDADTRALAAQLRSVPTQSLPAPLFVGASWQLEPSLNFYREKNHMDWMQPIRRGSLIPGAVAYALIADDRKMLDTLNLQLVARWPLSGAMIAKPKN